MQSKPVSAGNGAVAGDSPAPWSGLPSSSKHVQTLIKTLCPHPISYGILCRVWKVAGVSAGGRVPIWGMQCFAPKKTSRLLEGVKVGLPQLFMDPFFKIPTRPTCDKCLSLRGASHSNGKASRTLCCDNGLTILSDASSSC